MHHQVGVAHGLPQPDEQVKNVGVVVEHGAALHVGAKHGLGCVHGQGGGGEGV